MVNEAVGDLVAKAAEKAAKDLGLETEEESTEQPGDEEGTEEETDKEAEEELEEEEQVEAEEEEVHPPKKKPVKTIPEPRFNEVYGRMKQLERVVMQLTAQQQAPRKEEPKPEKEEPLPDFEELTNKELYQYIIKNLGGQVKGALREAISPLTTFVESSKQEKADQEVALAAKQFPDYFDYATEMIEISNRNPKLNPKEVYLLAKGDKAAVTKSVVKRQKDKMLLKKKANVEKRSSSVDKISENKEFKTVRDAGLAMAKKLGLT